MSAANNAQAVICGDCLIPLSQCSHARKGRRS